MKYSFKHIESLLGNDYEIEGSILDIEFEKALPITDADETSIVWLNPTRSDTAELLKYTKAKIIICSKEQLIQDQEKEKVFIKVASPKLVYLRIIGKLFKEVSISGVHPSAFVDVEAIIHPTAYIGPFSFIGKVTIGEGTIIKGHCHISDRTDIGRNVIIHAGTVIGSDGFGYSRNENGAFEKFPHLGGVVIEDNVEIGANTCIDRGTLGNTIIKAGAKIDNLVHIAHNVLVGEDTAVIANSMIGGSTVIGNRTWIAPSASLRDAITIGSDVVIGLGALVTKSVPDAEVWAGFPAKRIK